MKTPIRHFDVAVVGSGAAGYNAALRLREQSDRSVCIVTEGVTMGTSRNTGSDKQTYYKLGLGGDCPDSVRNMAENLFSCGAVDGDTALCEAALSARSFLHLCECGVAFPQNRYGEFVGYKTDHDPFARATSAGPLTSKDMTEALERRAAERNIPVLDGLYVVEILTDEEVGVVGLLTVDKSSGDYVALSADAVILCTGGPGGIYADSVYPLSQTGSTGLALLCGAPLQNMTEWQYGLASTAPRWNVSGTYMQVLPRFVSVDETGEEHEFLRDCYEDIYEALSTVFLKGYQWPFDAAKAKNGSSVIDLAVYRETAERGRKVYLDFTKNPFGLDKIDFTKLSFEAYDYLRKADALCGTPIERLNRMNRPAVELYQSKGLDIEKEYLPIALCAQHNNGGVAVDLWWQSRVKDLFAAGECAGTHGVTRPGGSALNAGQVGSLRAATYLSSLPKTDKSAAFEAALDRRLPVYEAIKAKALSLPDTVETAIRTAARRMSDYGGALRNPVQLQAARAATAQDLASLYDTVGVADGRHLDRLFALRSILLTSGAVLAACEDYAATVGKSRGSALYTDPCGTAADGFGDTYRFTPETDRGSYARIQEVAYREGGFAVSWRPVRPLPTEEDFFETVWRQYRENKNIY